MPCDGSKPSKPYPRLLSWSTDRYQERILESLPESQPVGSKLYRNTPVSFIVACRFDCSSGRLTSASPTGERSYGSCTASNPIVVLRKPSGEIPDIRRRVAAGMIATRRCEEGLIVHSYVSNDLGFVRNWQVGRADSVTHHFDTIYRLRSQVWPEGQIGWVRADNILVRARG